MSYYRKKPVVIEALRYNGANQREIAEFVGEHLPCRNDNVLLIPTLESPHEASVGDWIIRGVKGECYPCKPDIFEMTYEPVEPPR